MGSHRRDATRGGARSVTVTAARTSDGMLAGTITVQPANTAPLIVGGPFDGWQVIGTAERRICPPRHYGGNGHGAYRYTALEVREDDAAQRSARGRSPPENYVPGQIPWLEGTLRILSQAPSRCSASIAI